MSWISLRPKEDTLCLNCLHPSFDHVIDYQRKCHACRIGSPDNVCKCIKFLPIGVSRS